MKRFFPAAFAFVLGVFALSARGQAVVPEFADYEDILGGTLTDGTWSGLSSSSRPGYPASVGGNFNQWPAPIQPDGGNASLLLGPTTGFETDATDFLSDEVGGGIYTFFSRTHFSIQSSAPLAGLQSLVFQVYMAEGDDTGSLTVKGTPSLSLTTTVGSFVVPATYSLLLSSTPASVNGFDTNLNLLAYQWDLSGVEGAIQSYSLDWQVAMHSINYGANLTESTAVHSEDILAVPEPSIALLAIAGLSFALFFRRRLAND